MDTNVTYIIVYSKFSTYACTVLAHNNEYILRDWF